MTSGWLYTSWAREAREVSEEATTGPAGSPRYRAERGAEVNGAFNRALAQAIYTRQVQPEALFWGTPIRSGHTEKFVQAFERLLRLAERYDDEGVIADATRGGTHGRVYRFMVESRPINS